MSEEVAEDPHAGHGHRRLQQVAEEDEHDDADHDDHDHDADTHAGETAEEHAAHADEDEHDHAAHADEDEHDHAAHSDEDEHGEAGHSKDSVTMLDAATLRTATLAANVSGALPPPPSYGGLPILYVCAWFLQLLLELHVQSVEWRGRQDAKEIERGREVGERARVWQALHTP